MSSLPLKLQTGPRIRSAADSSKQVRRIPTRPAFLSRLADDAFRYATLLCAVSILAIVGLILYELIERSQLSIGQFGWKFFTGTNWDPVAGDFGALPFVYGTLVSSLVALIIAVPLAIGVAIFITEMCPRALRGILSFFTELLAAIPSVIYGLWAVFVLVPLMREHVQPFLAKYLPWTGLFTGPPYGIGMLTAGIVLAIMVIPSISSITREVMSAVPQHQREAVLALGATRWEMIRTGVLRNARAGILGGIILGLGRALDRKSTRLNSSHVSTSYAVFCLKKKNTIGSSGSATPPPPISRSPSPH